MDIEQAQIEIESFVNDVLNEFDIKLKPYVDDNTKNIIDEYRNSNSNIIPDLYKVDSIVKNCIYDYVGSNSIINTEEIKSTVLRILINVVLEYQYSLTVDSRKIDFENFNINSKKVEDLVKINFIANNPNIVGNLAFIGTNEMLYRDICEDLNLNIYPMNEDEYKYIVKTKELLKDNFDLLYKGNLNEIFNKLGNLYREDYLINEVNSYIKRLSKEDIDKLGLTDEEKELLVSTSGISFEYINSIKQKEEIEKVEEELNLKEVDYVKKDGVQYVKFNDENNLTFAEIVGNITPQERIEKIKNGISNLPSSGIIKADDISKEIKDDMIISGEFKNINNVDTNILDDQTNIGIDAMKEEGYNDMKIDVRTGMITDGKGKVYDLDVNSENNVELNRLEENSDDVSNISFSADTNTDAKTIEQLEEYGVSKEEYLSADEAQKRIIRDLYGIGKHPEEIENENTKGVQFVKKNPNINGYISSFIVAFVIGAFGGMLAMAILSLSR